MENAFSARQGQFMRPGGRSADSRVALKVLSHSLDLTGLSAVSIFSLAAPSLICALLFRGGFVIHRSGVTFVKADGSPTSRLRIFWRMLITCLPAGLILLSQRLLHEPVATITALALSAFSLYAIVRCVLSPERSLADRLAGTWTVPR